MNNKTTTTKSGLTNAPKKANNAKVSELPDRNENKTEKSILRCLQRRAKYCFKEIRDSDVLANFMAP